MVIWTKKTYSACPSQQSLMEHMQLESLVCLFSVSLHRNRAVPASRCWAQVMPHYAAGCQKFVGISQCTMCLVLCLPNREVTFTQSKKKPDLLTQSQKRNLNLKYPKQTVHKGRKSTKNLCKILGSHMSKAQSVQIIHCTKRANIYWKSNFQWITHLL